MSGQSGFQQLGGRNVKHRIPSKVGLYVYQQRVQRSGDVTVDGMSHESSEQDRR
jgi:hypothetical protein